MTKNNKKKGFTLVELSIVLVIIGLLIGGILVAQSLIDSTKIQSFVRQLGQYDAAVGTFADKFGDLPGDNTLFTSTGSTVDGNIEDDNGAILLATGEIAQFWSELSQSGLKNEGGDDFEDMEDSAGISPGTDSPKASLGTNATVVAAGASGANYYFVAQFTNSTSTTIATADALTPADALAVDLKMDDGAPNLGLVMAHDQATLDAAGVAVTTTTCASATATTGTYVVATETDVCQLRVRIGSTTGALK